MLQICYKTQSQLSRQYQQGTLSHALIIQGMEGSGKEALAQWLIDLLICQKPLVITNVPNGNPISQACQQCKACLLRKSGSYPDHLLLSSENKTLGVDDIRRGNAFLEKTAHLGKVKTILIPKAQVMTIAAANALLKTLEEPSDNSYIVLIAEEIDSLLPTIISRCAVYAIRPMVGDALLKQLNLSNNSSVNGILNDNAFVNLSQLPELTEDDTLKAFNLFKHYFVEYLYEGKNEEKVLNQLIDNKHSIRWLEKITCNLIRQYYLNHKPDITSDIDAKISIQKLHQIYQTIINSNKLVKSYTQANQQFFGEQLLMTINNIVRS